MSSLFLTSCLAPAIQLGILDTDFVSVDYAEPGNALRRCFHEMRRALARGLDNDYNATHTHVDMMRLGFLNRTLYIYIYSPWTCKSWLSAKGMGIQDKISSEPNLSNMLSRERAD